MKIAAPAAASQETAAPAPYLLADILRPILAKLPLEDLGVARQVNKEWRELGGDAALRFRKLQEAGRLTPTAGEDLEPYWQRGLHQGARHRQILDCLQRGRTTCTELPMAPRCPDPTRGYDAKSQGYVCVSADGAWVATEQILHAVHIAPTASDTPPHSVPCEWVDDLCFSPDNRKLMINDLGGIKVYDLESRHTAEVQFKHPHRSLAAWALSHDGRFLAVARHARSWRQAIGLPQLNRDPLRASRVKLGLYDLTAAAPRDLLQQHFLAELGRHTLEFSPCDSKLQLNLMWQVWEIALTAPPARPAPAPPPAPVAHR